MKKFITIATLALGLASCSQSLLDIDQQGVSSIDTYYSNATDANAKSLAVELYRNYYINTGADYLTQLAEAADEVTSWPRDNFIRMHSFNTSMNSQNHPMNDTFSALYKVIYQCNKIIDEMPEDSNEKKQVMGEAYFFRGLAYMNLIRGWGTPPLVDHALANNELEQPNGDTAALWEMVIGSFRNALDRVPSKTTLGGERTEVGGRVSSQAVQAELGKAYLLSGDKAQAAATLKLVINSGLYKLIDNFSMLYRPQSDFCDEYLWEINMEDGDAANYYSEAAGDRRMFMGWASEVTMPGTAWNIGKSVWGYAQAPTLNFVNFMYDRGEYGDARWMGTVWDYSQLLQKWQELEGDDMKTADQVSGKLWLQKGAPVIGSRGFFRSKFYIYKEDIYETATGSMDQFTKANWPGMRYAEVLLMYAEAVAGNDTDGLGLKGINLIRNRAGLGSLTSYTMQDVKDERRAELFCEGERFYDLVRWGDAPNVLKGTYTQQYSFYGYVDGTDATITGRDAWSKYKIVAEDVAGAQDFKAGKNELFPFPYTEVLQNSQLNQNPGW